MNAITVKNLTKKFKEATVLNDISVEFESGKIYSGSKDQTIKRKNTSKVYNTYPDHIYHLSEDPRSLAAPCK